VRIVADTNTALSGLLWQGPPRRLIDLARERALTLCTSTALLAELAEVIGRPKFAARVHDATDRRGEPRKCFRSRLARRNESRPDDTTWNLAGISMPAYA
jgi:hypothetical protein